MTLVIVVPRPGAFAANFNPETLDRFRDFCRQQGKQYTKVLERLAEIYLETGGAVLDAHVVVPSRTATPRTDRQVELEDLQNKMLRDLLQRVEVLEKQKVKADYEMDRMQKSIAFMRSGLNEPNQQS